MTTKYRHNVNGYMIEPMKFSDDADKELDLSIDSTEESDNESINELIPINTIYDLSGRSMDIEDTYKILHSSEKEDNIGMVTSRLDDMYDGWIGYLIKK